MSLFKCKYADWRGSMTPDIATLSVSDTSLEPSLFPNVLLYPSTVEASVQLFLPSRTGLGMSPVPGMPLGSHAGGTWADALSIQPLLQPLRILFFLNNHFWISGLQIAVSTCLQITPC